MVTWRVFSLSDAIYTEFSAFQDNIVIPAILQEYSGQRRIVKPLDLI
jgi:hypothetical protein